MTAQVSPMRPVLHKLITTSPRQSRLISSPLARASAAPLTSQDSSPVQGSFRPSDISIPTHAQTMPATPSLLAKTRRRTDSLLSPTLNRLNVGSSRLPIPATAPPGKLPPPILAALLEAEEPRSTWLHIRTAMEDAVRKTCHLLVDPQRIHSEKGQAYSRGSFGEVCLGWLAGKTAGDLKRVAVKTIQLRSNDAPSNRKLLRHILREVIPWHELDHPNIAPFVGYTFNGQSAGILSEFQEGGNLREYMQSNPGKGLHLAPQISSGLAYLHTRTTPVVHGDVKPENVVLSVEGVPKLVDFGLSTIWDDPLFQGLRTSDGCRHTTLYADPVLLDDIPRTIYTDLWALGWIIYELATSRRPYHRRKSLVAILNAISKYELPTRDTDVVPHPEIIWPILDACWTKDFPDRWSAGKIASKLMQAL